MKLDYAKSWFERSAQLEGEAEIGAGISEGHSAEAVYSVVDTRLALGQFVELGRRSKGWNAEDLARKAGIDAAEVLEIERDPYCEPEPDAVYKLAKVFHVSSSKLMELAGLVKSRTPHLREEAIRFAAQSESMAKLSDTERQALEAFVTALSETSKKESD